jgi:hypothetical protein
MRSGKKSAERRALPRYKVEERAFAVLRPQFIKLGRIIDIGLGGLAFSYLITNGEKSKSPELDIFIAGSEFYLERLPIKGISESRMPRNPSGSSLPVRRFSVQFGELEGFHISQLNHFIRNCTSCD